MYVRWQLLFFRGVASNLAIVSLSRTVTLTYALTHSRAHARIPHTHTDCNRRPDLPSIVHRAVPAPLLRYSRPGSASRISRRSSTASGSIPTPATTAFRRRNSKLSHRNQASQLEAENFACVRKNLTGTAVQRMHLRLDGWLLVPAPFGPLE